MSISPETSLQSVVSVEDTPLTPFQIAYFKAMAQDEAHAAVLEAFLNDAQDDPRITRAFLARRTGKDPAQITKYLGAAGNWTLDTYALLLAGLGYKATLGREKLTDRRWANESHDLSGLDRVDHEPASPAPAPSEQQGEQSDGPVFGHHPSNTASLSAISVSGDVLRASNRGLPPKVPLEPTINVSGVSAAIPGSFAPSTLPQLQYLGLGR